MEVLTVLYKHRKGSTWEFLQMDTACIHLIVQGLPYFKRSECACELLGGGGMAKNLTPDSCERATRS